MKCVLFFALMVGSVLAQSRSSLPVEPGTIALEGLLPKPVRLTIVQESPIFYTSLFDRTLGSMAPTTVVTLIGLSDSGYKVRGRARHGDVSGWMRKGDVHMPDPTFPEKLKALYSRQTEVAAMIAAHQIAIGMTRQEAQLSLGKPTRTNTRVTAAGREERLEYAIFERVPQAAVGRAPDGQLVQSVIYVKVEVGTLSVSFKNNVVEAIEETKGNPLQGGGVKILPVPITLW
jgi:hypothetical protein